MLWAIIGYRGSGKTALFNLLTHKGGSGHLGKGLDIAVMKVPDPNLEKLAKIFSAGKITNIEIEFADTAGEIGKGGTATELQKADALVICVRAFDAGFGEPQPEKDLFKIFDELVLFDLGVLERKLENIEKSLRAPKHDERIQLEKEKTLVSELKKQLDAGKPIRDIELSDELSSIVQNFGLLTAKPCIVVFNSDEERYKTKEKFIESAIDKHRHIEASAIAVKLELELGELSRDDAEAFRRELQIDDDALGQFLNKAYRALDMITIYTGCEKEIRAWAIKRGSRAIDAAGKIHTDIARGFIRAETIHYEKLLEFGGWNEAKNAGAVRQEGKEYILQDGDVILIKFAI